MEIGRRKRCGKCRSCGKTKRRFSHSSLDLRSTLPTTPAAAVLPQTQLSFYSHASWSGCTDGFSLRLNHRKDGAISVREADRGISGVSALGGLKRQSATTGPYHKAREFDVAFLAGGSGPSYST